jgi:serine protease Do
VDNRIAPGDASIGVTSGSNTSNDGILIDEVLPGSAASRARLRPGDVIVAIDGRETRSLLELQKLIGSRRVGDRVTVRVRRGVRYLTVELVLRPR